METCRKILMYHPKNQKQIKMGHKKMYNTFALPAQILEENFNICPDWVDLIEYIIQKFLHTMQHAPHKCAATITENMDSEEVSICCLARFCKSVFFSGVFLRGAFMCTTMILVTKDTLDIIDYKKGHKKNS